MKHKQDVGSDFIYGLHTVTAVMAYQPNRCKKLFIARKSATGTLVDLAEKNHLAVELVERQWLEKKFGVGSDAQGVVLQCAPFPYADFDELKDRANTLFVLDSWQDPVNLGRAARAALCFAVDGIVICQDRAAQISGASEKSAVGALAEIPVARVVNLAAALKKLKESGFFVYGADEHGSVPINLCDFSRRRALVVGQEGEGLRELTKKNCDVLVSIPMAKPGICLNAADAALIIAYQLASPK
ncbi:MAG TPA: RNA methyltransferase [Myxococcota bacterium]|nr:RNA methyltransferase [Myxococcota bacterium]